MRVIIAICAYFSIVNTSTSFTPPLSSRHATQRIAPKKLPMVVTSSPEVTIRDEINAMYVKDIRHELESYGIDCTSIFEKKELVEELVRARRENWIQSEFDVDGSFKSDFAKKVDKSDFNNVESTSSDCDSVNLEENDKSWFQQGLEDMAGKFSKSLKDEIHNKRIKLEMTRLEDTSVKELKQELESYGISTRSYFEKREFIRALAEARVDGTKKKSTFSSRSGSAKSVWDPMYRDVTVTRFDASVMDPSGIIDVYSK